MPHHLAPRARVDPFVGGDAGELVGGDVADAASAGLDGVHLHLGEVGQDVRHVDEFGPVDLHVLARGEVAVAFVVVAADAGEGLELRGAQDAVGHGDAQHGRKALDIQPIAQPQLLKLIVRQLPGEVALGLRTILLHPLVDEPLVELAVLVHALLAGNPR